MNPSISQLAINGGHPVRSSPFPSRRLFDKQELDAVREVFEASWNEGADFGFQGKFEEAYMKDFCELHGGGFADAVSSGTAAVFLSMAALDLPRNGEVICSPVTDPGGISPLLFLNLSPVLADAAPGGFNTGAEQVETCITSQTKAILITHVGGMPADMEKICMLANRHSLPIVEDCSQAHGALINGRPVGTFGEVAAFSTMFSKSHASGGCGGIVYTRREDLYKRVRALADRGKSFFKEDYNPKDPAQFLFPALNFNQNELSSAIGRSTLAKLPEIIRRRIEIMKRLADCLRVSKAMTLLPVPKGCTPSIFFLTVVLDIGRLSVNKLRFAKAVQAEGIPINPDYRYVLSEWPWLTSHCSHFRPTINAINFREASFNLLFHERFSDKDVDDLATALLKVEHAFLN